MKSSPQLLVCVAVAISASTTPVSARRLHEGLLDPDLQPKFVEDVPEALSDAFTMTLYDKRTQRNTLFTSLFSMLGALFGRRRNGASLNDGKPAGVVDMGIYPIVSETGLIDPVTRERLKTPGFGYGTSAATASWPGPTFEVKSQEPITVRWNNNLQGVTDFPFTSLNGSKTVLDETIHWAYSIKGYKSFTIAKDGMPLVVHLHGIAADQYVDGFPEHFYSPGFKITGPDLGTKEYFYPNAQPAGNLWYHDHTLGITRLTVHAGLAGFYFIRDDRDTGSQLNTLGLPYGDFEKAYAIQDRMFKNNGELFMSAYPGEPFYDSFFPDLKTPFDTTKASALTEYFGDFMLVNGKIWPKQLVRPTTYRMHLLNGCDSRFLIIEFYVVEPGATSYDSGSIATYTVVGSDQGLLNEPVLNIRNHVLPTGSRTDIVFDFTPYIGKRVIMVNNGGDIAYREFKEEAFWLFDHTDMIMAFDVDSEFLTATPIKPSWSFAKEIVPEADRVRRVGLFEGRDDFNRLQPLQGGELTPNVIESFTWDDPISELIPVGSVEEWDIFNFSTGAHPIHLHYVHVEIVERKKIKFDTQAINRECGERGAVNGVCLETKETIQHGGGKGLGYKALIPINNAAAYGEEFTVDSTYVTERGQYKDTIIALPGQITRVRAKFDRTGRFVWHCHFLSHEDHEMMRMFQVV